MGDAACKCYGGRKVVLSRREGVAMSDPRYPQTQPSQQSAPQRFVPQQPVPQQSAPVPQQAQTAPSYQSPSAMPVSAAWPPNRFGAPNGFGTPNGSPMPGGPILNGLVHYPEVNLRTARKAFSRVGWTLLVWMLANEILAMVMKSVGDSALHAINPSAGSVSSMEWLSLLLSDVVQYGFALPLCLIVAFTVPKYPPQPRTHAPGASFGVKDWLMVLVMGYPIMFVGGLFGSWSADLLSGGKFNNILDSVTSSTGPADIAAQFLTFVVLAPLSEEFVFRRCIIDSIRIYGEKIAVLSSALLFGLMHSNLYQFFYTFGWGLLWAYVYVRTGRLRYTIALHATVNFFGGVVAPLLSDNVTDKAMDDLTSGDVQRMSHAFTQSGPALVGYLVYIACVLILVVVGTVFIANAIRRRIAYFQQSPRELAPRNRVSVALGNPGIIVFGALTLFATIVAPLMMRFG